MIIVTESDEEQENLDKFFLDYKTSGLFHEKVQVNAFSVIRLPKGHFDLLMSVAEITGVVGRPEKINKRGPREVRR
jgi:hypothetical protein